MLELLLPRVSLIASVAGILMGIHIWNEERIKDIENGHISMMLSIQEAAARDARAKVRAPKKAQFEIYHVEDDHTDKSDEGRPKPDTSWLSYDKI